MSDPTAVPDAPGQVGVPAAADAPAAGAGADVGPHAGAAATDTAADAGTDAGPGAGAAATAPLPDDLLRLRGSIDNIDAALIHLLAERFKATQQVGVLKAAHGLPASDPAREARQVARLRDLAHQADLDPVFAEKFLAFIVEEVIRHHEQIAQDHARRP